MNFLPSGKQDNQQEVFHFNHLSTVSIEIFYHVSSYPQQLFNVPTGSKVLVEGTEGPNDLETMSLGTIWA